VILYFYLLLCHASNMLHLQKSVELSRMTLSSLNCQFQYVSSVIFELSDCVLERFKPFDLQFKPFKSNHCFKILSTFRTFQMGFKFLTAHISFRSLQQPSARFEGHTSFADAKAGVHLIGYPCRCFPQQRLDKLDRGGR
jgi:hypothetical protein